MPHKPRFEWDERKADANKRKHSVSFELAKEVFEDKFKVRLYRGDEYGEPRWWTMGLVGSQLLIVVHTWEDNEEGETIRIISARKATAGERRRYEEG